MIEARTCDTSSASQTSTSTDERGAARLELSVGRTDAWIEVMGHTRYMSHSDQDPARRLPCPRDSNVAERARRSRPGSHTLQELHGHAPRLAPRGSRER